MTDLIRPRFLPSALELLSKEAKDAGLRSIIPYWLLGMAGVGAGAAYVVPETFWSTDKWDVSTAVLSGILTFNGLVLALGWGAFARIYDVILRGEFGRYLAKNGLLNEYIVHITYAHIFKIAAIVVSAVALIFVLVEGIPIWVDRAVFAATLTFTAYGIKQAVDAVTAMNDLVWLASVFEAGKAEHGGNVSTLHG